MNGSWLLSITVLPFCTGLLFFQSVLIDSPQKKKERKKEKIKGAIAAGWSKRGEKNKKRRSLARLLCSFIFHCKSNRHSLSSPFSLTTAMALATAARLSFLPLCLKIMSTVRRESGGVGGIPPLSCRRSVSMTIICIVQRLQT